MYFVGRFIDGKGANVLMIESSDGVVGYLPVYEDKKKAVKASNKGAYPVYEIAELINYPTSDKE